MSDKFFTADQHFFHKNILPHRSYDTLGEMHEDLIGKYNTAVHPGDVVYFLGDVALKTSVINSADEMDVILSRLHGTKMLIRGNHDHQNWNFFKEAYRKRFAKIEDVMYIKILGQRTFLSHYAHRTWRASVHGSWHLFGHSHGSMEPYGKSFDIGVDANNFAPVSSDQVAEKMTTLEEHWEANQHNEK